MKQSGLRKIFTAFIILCIALWLHSTIGNNVFSFAPAPLVLSILIAQISKHRFKSLAVIAVISEIFTTFPPGIMTAIVLAPWIIQRLTKKITVDISFYFLGIIVFTAALQVLIAFGYEIISLLLNNHITVGQVFDVFPYYTIIMIIGATSLSAFVMAIVWREMFPLQANASLISRRR